jgi:hypothetical protein
MTTRDTVEGYFSSLKQRKGWEGFLSDDVSFTSFTSPIRQVSGRAAFLEATKRFYSMITAVEVRDLLVDGDKACALTSYQLQPAGGPAFRSDVAEVFASHPFPSNLATTAGPDLALSRKVCFPARRAGFAPGRARAWATLRFRAR